MMKKKNDELSKKVNISNILSTVSECTASTNSNDIAGASALAELKDSFTDHIGIIIQSLTQSVSGGQSVNVQVTFSEEDIIPTGSVVLGAQLIFNDDYAPWFNASISSMAYTGCKVGFHNLYTEALIAKCQLYIAYFTP